MVGAKRGHQRADRLKPQSQKTSQFEHMDHSLVLLNETYYIEKAPTIIIIVNPLNHSTSPVLPLTAVFQLPLSPDCFKILRTMDLHYPITES